MSSSQTPPSNETENTTDESQQGQTPTAAPAPFKRGQIVWGRPPQTVFRAGPLPRDEGLARLMAMPPHPEAPKPKVKGSTAVGIGGSIMGASNIPQKPTMIQPDAKAAQTQQSPQRATPAAAPLSARPGLMTGSLVPGAGVVKSKPQAETQPAPQPEPAPEPKDAMVEASTAEPIYTLEVEPVVAKRRPVASEATAATPVDSRRKPSRLMIVATAALVAAAGAAAVWWSQKNGPDSVPDAVAPATVPVEVTAPDVAAPVETTVPATTVETPTEVAPAPVAAVTPATTASAPVTQRPQTAPTTHAPTKIAPANTAAATQPTRTVPPITTMVPRPEPSTPAPVVVAPPAETVQGPPPTAAAPTQSDPDAPVVTRPQRLD